MKLALIAVQLEVDAAMLATGETYRAAIEQAVAHAVADAGAAEMRLVVVPELTGHLALFALASPRAKRAKTFAAALAGAALRRPLDVLRGVATTRLLDGRHAVLAALAPDAARWWKSLFGPLALRHAAYVVAGSHLRLGNKGELTNASMLFGPDGRLLTTTDKINLVPGFEDGSPGALHLARGDQHALPIADTPAGTLATLIGYDAQDEPRSPHERFVALGPIAAGNAVTLIANPAADRAGDGRGPAAALAFAPHAVCAQLVGHVLDLSFAGRSRVLAAGRVLAEAASDRRAAAVVAIVDR